MEGSCQGDLCVFQQSGVECVKKYVFYKYPEKVGHFFEKSLVFLKQNDVNGMKKVLVSLASRKSRSIFVNNHWLFKQNEVKCLKKYQFHKHPVKVTGF